MVAAISGRVLPGIRLGRRARLLIHEKSFLGIWSLARKMEVSNKEKFQMRDDKVQCQCCGKWMVPRPIFSRGIWSNGWRVGGGRVIGSICPFCLDEDWDGVERVHRGVLFKTVALAISVFITYASIFIFVVIVSLIEESLANSLFIEANKDYISVSCVFASIFFGYRSYKWLVNTTRLPF
ncbi:hypothetical protein ACE0DR_27935 [Azotobacter sp. CWF10]